MRDNLIVFYIDMVAIANRQDTNNQEIRELIKKIRARHQEYLDTLTPGETPGAIKNTIRLQNSRSYSHTDKLLAEMLKISYSTNRPSIFNFNGIILNYMSELSTSFYSHYEDKDNIVVAVHGANSSELLLSSFSAFAGIQAGNQTFVDFCRKFDELLKSDKKIILTGHSLGSFAILRCREQFNVRGNNAVLFAPYIPLVNQQFSRDSVRKILYNNDFLANNILKAKVVVNTLEFEPNILSKSFLNGHGLFNFINEQQMKRDLKKVHNYKM